MARCNLPPEEREQVLKFGDWYHDTDDMDRCKAFFDQYMFIEIPEFDKKARICTCSNCGQAWAAYKRDNKYLFSLHHKDMTECPHCGKRLQVQMIGKLQKGYSLYQTAAVSFINVTPEGNICMESGIAFDEYYCEYSYGEARPCMEITFIGKKRYFFRPGAVMGWRRCIGEYACRDMFGLEDGWEGMANITEPFSYNPLYGFDGYGYVVGFEKIRDSEFRYCAIDKYYTGYHTRDIFEELNPLRLVPQYLAEYALHPQIEMAVKLGMREAVGELVRDGRKNHRDIDWNASNPADFVRLSKAEAKEFFNDPSLDFLKWYHTALKAGEVKSILEARTIVGVCGIPDDMRLTDLLKRHGVRLFRVAKYAGSAVRMATWIDYVEAADRLGYDLSGERELFPRNLKERHDAATAAVKQEEIKLTETEYKKRKAKLEKKYAFTMDGLSIVVPRSAAEIVNEGNVLHICVGGYAARHIDGKTNILFLRHERRPERPFLCIELDNDGKLRQIHGYRNEGYLHAVDPRKKYAGWLSVWQEWYRSGSHRDRNGRPIIENEREEKTA